MRFCTWAHTVKRDGVWTRGEEDQIEVVTASNGRLDVKLRCRCGELTGTLPSFVVWEWLNPFGPIIYRSHDGAPCCVVGCASNETEYHHFAPRNTFGLEADDWPVLPLCVAHHHAWHRRMDGYRWHQAAS